MNTNQQSESYILPSITKEYVDKNLQNGSPQPSGPGSNQILEAQNQWNNRNYDAAYKLYEAAIQEGIQKDWLASAHNCLGQIEIMRGDIYKAVNHFMKCLAIPEHDSGDVWESAIRLYTIYDEAGRLQDAQELKELASTANKHGFVIAQKADAELRALTREYIHPKENEKFESQVAPAAGQEVKKSDISFEEMDEIIQRVDKMSLFDTSKKITASVVIKHKILQELTAEEKKELMGCCLIDHISHISNRYSMMTIGDAIVATRCLKCGQQYWTRVSRGGESDVNVMKDIIKFTTDHTTVMDGSETDLIADFDKTAEWIKKGSPYRNIKDTGRIEIWTKGKDNESQMTVVSETKKTLFKRLFNRK